jgi:hypothetical protein
VPFEALRPPPRPPSLQDPSAAREASAPARRLRSTHSVTPVGEGHALDMTGIVHTASDTALHDALLLPARNSTHISSAMYKHNRQSHAGRLMQVPLPGRQCQSGHHSRPPRPHQQSPWAMRLGGRCQIGRATHCGLSFRRNGDRSTGCGNMRRGRSTRSGFPPVRTRQHTSRPGLQTQCRYCGPQSIRGPPPASGRLDL